MPDMTGASVRRLYDARVAQSLVQDDSAQRGLCDRLDRVIRELSIRQQQRGAKSSPLGWLFSRKAEIADVRGLYIYGSVGRGKTMLMDWFFELCPIKSKRRAHFHAFMQDVHLRIHKHRQAFKCGENREEDPIPPVAKDLAKNCGLLCFDEFHVLDIADAMILSRLFKMLFEEGVVLVATSNVAPDDLYQDGLNRSLFLPFVKMLKDQCDVWSLNARTDYRREKLSSVGAYQTPLNAKAHAAMDEAWKLATAHQTVEPLHLQVRGHTFDIPSASNDTARLGFDDLCAKPLGAADYLELADRFPTLFIDNVPILDFSKRNEAKRFIILIDVLYEAKTRLFISAVTGPDLIYQVKAGLKAGEFTRTSSRLFEMTSKPWLLEWQERSKAQP